MYINPDFFLLKADQPHSNHSSETIPSPPLASFFFCSSSPSTLSIYTIVLWTVIPKRILPGIRLWRWWSRERLLGGYLRDEGGVWVGCGCGCGCGYRPWWMWMWIWKMRVEWRLFGPWRGLVPCRAGCRRGCSYSCCSRCRCRCRCSCWRSRTARRSGGRKGSIVFLDPSFSGSKGLFLHPSFFVDYGRDINWGGG